MDESRAQARTDSPDDDDRVRASTAESVNAGLDTQRVREVAAYVGADPKTVRRRLAELDREWDTERVLEANAAAVSLLSLALAAVHSRRWLVLGAVVPGFLLQHALQGWCPPLELIRRLGVRTRKEIDAERTALKAVRGDFDGVSMAAQVDDPVAVAGMALEAARRR